MNARLDRERAYWDEAYRATGAEHRKYLWAKHVEGRSYIGQYFGRLTSSLKDKRILSLGGGIDRPAIEMAKAGNRVITVDIAPAAASLTYELAKRERVLDRLTTMVASAEEVVLEAESFDAVIFKRALHHMDTARMVSRAHALLASGGVLLAEEPVCLPKWLQSFHRRFPFHPDAPRTSDERELDADDLSFVRHTFPHATFLYFDCMSRESAAYVLSRLTLGWLLQPLGRGDYLLMNRYVPLLRHFATYVIIHAIRD
jgi:ubiquinone/menaquinone biosynthesis C-methylase UbiE